MPPLFPRDAADGASKWDTALRLSQERVRHAWLAIQPMSHRREVMPRFWDGGICMLTRDNPVAVHKV
jgi:hypothetical protein